MDSEHQIYIKKHYMAMLPQEIAASLGLKLQEVDNAFDRYGFKKQGNWTDEDDQKLRQMFQKHNTPYLSCRLGRTQSDIKKRIKALGLIKYTRDWPSAKVRTLINKHTQLSVLDLAALFNTTEIAIRNKLRQLDLEPKEL